VLGRAGACFIRTGSLQTLVGQMQFDDADLQALLANGRFDSVVLHEMLHVVGIGSLWRLRNLVAGSGTADPRYTGAIAIDRCGIVGFALECGTTVPLENTGGAGTAEVHWRESVFDRELMTGFAENNADMPLSVLTLGSLADMNFVVNERAADPFRSVAARVAPRAVLVPETGWEDVLEPLGEVTPFGLAQPLRPLAPLSAPRRPPSRPDAPRR
jgi:trimeric autotransporter adhesin